MSEMFLYTVKPRKTIVGLSGSANAIRTNKSLYLTKEDVYLCLKNATVYRRFANEGINERVTIDDVERVHRENYIPASEWDKFCAAEKSKGHGEVVDTTPVVEDTKKDEIPAEPEKEDEAPVQKVPVNEEESTHSEEIADNTAETAEESQSVEDDTAVESDDDEEIEKVTE